MSNDQHQLRCPDCGAEVLFDGDHILCGVACGRTYYHRTNEFSHRGLKCYERKERQLREALEGLLKYTNELSEAKIREFIQNHPDDDATKDHTHFARVAHANNTRQARQALNGDQP